MNRKLLSKLGWRAAQGFVLGLGFCAALSVAMAASTPEPSPPASTSAPDPAPLPPPPPPPKPLTPAEWATVKIYPRGAALPPSYANQDWTGPDADLTRMDACVRKAALCEVWVMDLNSDGVKEILFAYNEQWDVLTQGASGRWTYMGRMIARCGNRPFVSWLLFQPAPHEPFLKEMRKGAIKVIPPHISDLDVNGERLTFRDESVCAPG